MTAETSRRCGSWWASLSRWVVNATGWNRAARRKSKRARTEMQGDGKKHRNCVRARQREEFPGGS